MPIFEYQCKSCGTVSEFLLGVGHDQPVACKKCGSSALERLVSAPSFLSSGFKPASGQTCCGREERCDTPPCSSDGRCKRD